jgi:lysophospholipase L1-like esterase/pimeloyl-ACP methyl ester carboxylesterase
MKVHALLLSLIMLCVLGFSTEAKSDNSNNKSNFYSLSGKELKTGNQLTSSGKIAKVGEPLIHVYQANSSKGTILLFPGGEYNVLNIKSQGDKVAKFLNAEGFDVVVLEYRIAAEDSRSLALIDALQAIRKLKTDLKLFGLHDQQFTLVGIASGGHLAARAVQRLAETEQPDKLILISPAYLDETLKGTVYPAVMPPVQPKAQLFVSFAADENKDMVRCGQEYAKTWKGYDGQAIFSVIADSKFIGNSDLNPLEESQNLQKQLKTFLNSKPEIQSQDPNPATVPVEGYAKKRHAEKAELLKNNKYDLLMFGNSITHNFEKPEYQPIWNQFFAPRNALNLGTSAYRTENLIWEIQNLPLENQSPKVAIVEIGTNNIDEKNYPTRHTAGQLAGGIETIVKLLREKLPQTKIIVMRCFPGCYGGPNPTSHRAILERASDIVSKLADNKTVFYCDVNHVFLNLDGSINHDQMPDWLHPSPAGSKAWAQAMEPLLSQLMGDKSRDTDIPANTAIVPMPKLENDSYNWWDRHAEALRVKDSINPEIVLIGNSITHFWGGEPKLKYADGKPRKPNGPNAWASVFANHRVLNLGFGWDRTQNVLWRLDHGEIDGLHPRTIIMHLGTNNTSETANARMNSATEIVEGIRAVCMRLRSKVPGAHLVLMKVFPREEKPDHPRRILINEINRQLEIFARENNIDLLDIGPKMLASDGTLPKEIANDFCHPTEKGYQIWADEIRRFVEEP